MTTTTPYTETAAYTRLVTGHTGPIPTCCWCDQPLTSNEWCWGEQGSAGGFYSAHWACVWESPTGRFVVRTVQNGVTPPREHVRRYTTRRRAEAAAVETRQNNRREWPCGAQLDIFVAEILSEA